MAWWVFQNVVATAILAMVVAGVCRTFRISPGIRHALWMLVLIKFVTPPVLTWPWQVPDPLGIQALDARPETDSRWVAVAEPVGASGPRVGAPGLQTRGTDRAVSPNLIGTQNESANLQAKPEDQWLAWLLGLWAAVAIVMLIVEAVRLLRVARAVRSAGDADPAIVERVRVLSARLDIQPVPVLMMPNTTSPAMWCLGRPRLLWPAELPAEFTDACIDGLIVHELAHVKRRDHIVGWIELGASVVWWWNPLFWFVRSALREEAELACDGWVIAALPNGRRAYAESLLALSSVAAVDVPVSPMTAVLGVRARNRRALERRLVMIMKGRASHRLSMLGLVGLGMLAVASLPVWAAGTQQTPPPPPPAAVPMVVTAPIPTVTQTLPPPAAPVVASSMTTVTQQVPPQPRTAPPPPSTVPPSAVPPAPQGRPSAATLPAPGYPQPMTATSAPSAVPPSPASRPRGGVMAPSMAQTTTPVPARAGQGGAVAPTRAQTATAVPASGQQGGRGQGAMTVPVASRDRVVYVGNVAALPADAQTQVKSYQAERDALQQEIDRKLEAKRADLTKSLQALQESYTKAGKLDEAVAIRDYIRSLSGGRMVYREAR